MKIYKKDGTSQSFMPNKILTRIKKNGKDLNVDSDEIFKDVIKSIFDGITTTQIDELIANVSINNVTRHIDYDTFASRILISRMYKELSLDSYLELNNLHPIVKERWSWLEENEDRDNLFDFFGITTFLKKYSLKNGEGLAKERPQWMYKRIALFLAENKEEAKLFYDNLSNRQISLATPILLNAGTENPSMISCNLTFNHSDSSEGILDTMYDLSISSRNAAGIGVCIDNLRSRKSRVSTTGGNAMGVVKYIRMGQTHADAFNQGGKRPGAFAFYLSLWHKDILDFLSLKLPIGDEKQRARDIFLAVCINDNFMRALENKEDWYLFCPNDIEKAGLRPLYELWGEEYEIEYNKAIALGIGEKIDPVEIWDAILRSQTETGVPYVFYKDNANKYNMQDCFGTIRQSNLCIEITEYSDPENTAQCTLGAIPLPYCTNFQKASKVLTYILNRVIDKNSYSTERAKTAGLAQRAIAIGIAGLADYFAKNEISFTSETAMKLNIDIQREIYKGFIKGSQKFSADNGITFKNYENSRYAKGQFYPDFHGVKLDLPTAPMANSLGIANMPTASTSILLGVNECFEPFGSNIMVRKTDLGEFIVVNKWLIRDLETEGILGDDIMNKIIANEGSVQGIHEIPVHLQDRYKTIWEIPQKKLIQMAIDRATYICQSQSMNLYMSNPTYSKIGGALMFAWKNGLKTGCYYLRSESKLAKPKRLNNHIKGSAQVDADLLTEKDGISCFGCSA